jgi:hypothetical protein
MISLRQFRWFDSLALPSRWLIALGWGFGLTLVGQARLPAMELAQTKAETNDVKALLQQFDSIANQHQLDQLGAIYSPEFSNSDGLTFQQVEASLQSLWKLYPDLSYKTELRGWRQEGEAVIVDTVTNIKGNRPWLGKTANLTGEVSSRQTFINQKLVRQEVLSEKMTLTAGEKPPLIDVRLPEKVKPGQQYDFDVILQSPLNDDLLAGSAFAQDIDPTNYQFDPTQVKLELLQAGGLFKRVVAGDDPQWLSAFLVSPDGMVLVTQRLAIAP